MEPEQSARLEHILGHTPVGVAILDCANLRFRYANSYLLSWLEEPWRSQGVIGHALDEVISEEVRKAAEPILQQVCSTGQSIRLSDVPYEGSLETRGRTYWRISIELSPDFATQDRSSRKQPSLETVSEKGVENELLVTIEDVTSLVRSRLHLEAIHYVSSAIAGPFALPKVLDRILQSVHDLVGSTRCAVLLIDYTVSNGEIYVSDFEEYQRNEIRDPPGTTPTMTVAAQKGVHLSAKDWHPQVSEQLLLGQVVRDRHTLIITDTSKKPELAFPLLDDNGTPRRPGSVLCVPIFEPASYGDAGEDAAFNGRKGLDTARGAVLGSIDVYHRRARNFPAEEVELLEQFAHQAGLAIQNARLFLSINRFATEQATARERIEAEVVARTKELAQRNAALQEANAKLKTLERAREDFFTTMAHELKTPLANIRAHLSALQARDLQWSPQEQHDFLETADDQVERLVGMINHFLDASRVEAGALRLELEPILLPELFEDLQDRLEALITFSHRHLKIDIPPDLPAVVADYELIMRVLTNLLSNALRYAPEGDTVRLEAEPVSSTNDSPPSAVEIRVVDRGPGIIEERQGELFTRFSTFAAQRRPAADRPGQPVAEAEKRQAGIRWSPPTGLGLYISRGIIEAHSSTLRMKSSPGQGTTFAFTLAIATEVAPIIRSVQ